MPKLTLNEKVLLQIGKEKTIGRVISIARNATTEFYTIKMDSGEIFKNVMDDQIKEGFPNPNEANFYKSWGNNETKIQINP